MAAGDQNLQEGVPPPRPRPPLPAPSARKQPRTLHAHSPHTPLTHTGTLCPQTLEDAKFVYDEENEKWTRDAETIERGSRVRVKVTSVNQQAQSIVSVPPLPPPPLTASPTAVRAGDRPEVRLSVCRVCCRRRCSICVQIPPSYHFVRHRFAERFRCRRAKQTFFLIALAHPTVGMAMSTDVTAPLETLVCTLMPSLVLPCPLPLA